MLVAAAFTLSAVAQTKAEKSIQKKLDKSDAAIENPKKAAKLNTWLDRSDLYVDASVVFTKNLLKEVPAMQLTMSSIAGEPNSIEEAVVGADTYSKYIYNNFDVYVTMDGMVAFWEVKNEMIEGAMSLAVENFLKAKEVDAPAFMKSSKVKNLAERITAELSSTGISAYSLKQFDVAGNSFSEAFTTQEAIGNFDSISCYYAAVCYTEGEIFDKALPLLEKLVSVNYLQDGLTYFYLASAQKGLGDMEGYVKSYETGFTQFPQNPTIMAGLINAYLETERNTEDVVKLIKQAEELDPQNVSLYLVESDIWEKAGNLDKAYAALDQAIAVDPNSIPAYYNYAVRKVVESDEVVAKAQKLDINDVKGYNELVAKAETLRKECVTYLEKCMSIDETNESVISLLGQMYFVCRDLGDEYAQKLEAHRAKYPQE